LSKSDTGQTGKDSRRAQTALDWRCRRGVPDALRSLLYRGGDYWYSAALMVCRDEETAAEAVAEMWERLLNKLGGWRFAGRLEQRARKTLLNALTAQSSYGQAENALQSAAQMAPQELISMPPALTEQLLAVADAASDRIGRAYQARRRALRIAEVGLVTITIVAAVIAVWAAVVANQVSMTQVAWGCVQQRVIAQDLSGTIADAMSEFVFAEAESQQSSTVLQRAGLILEEIANAQKAASPLMMRYLAERSRAEHLAEGLQGVADCFPGPVRSELMNAALILEEVENW